MHTSSLLVVFAFAVLLRSLYLRFKQRNCRCERIGIFDDPDLKAEESFREVALEALKMKVPRGMMAFRPQVFFQEIYSDHITSNDLEFKMDFETGRNFGRLSSGRATQDEPGQSFSGPSFDSPAYVSSVTAFVENSPFGDGEYVCKRLRDAASWGDVQLVEDLIRSTYCTVDIGCIAMNEAAARGHCDVVRALSKAGASALVMVNGKSALHVAVENSQEEACKLLVELFPKVLECVNSSGMTAIEVAQMMDQPGLARRLKALAA